MNIIIPKSEAKGTDICGMDHFCYIIRSDLGCYMKTSDFHKGSDISVLSLHPACQDGDHYLGSKDGSFFIIKGNSFRRVMDLTTDRYAEVHDLHPNCQGGDHYFSAFGNYYIVFKEKGTFRITTNMNQDSNAVEYKLPSHWTNGLYYWGQELPLSFFNGRLLVCFAGMETTSNYMPVFCFLKPTSEWGVEFCVNTDFSKDERSNVYSVHPNVLNFLPGGLTVTKGPSFGIWENIKTITNHSRTPVTWTKKITKKVGFNKEKMTQITHNWKIDASASIETGALSALITKCQFSFSAEYGGSHVSTESESWNEVTEEEEKLSFELKPNERLYLWQYKLGFGKESVLFCRDLMITDDPNPPTEVPLPPAQS